MSLNHRPCRVYMYIQLLRNYLVTAIQSEPKNWTCLNVDIPEKGPNLHRRSFKYYLFNSHEFLLPLKLGISCA